MSIYQDKNLFLKQNKLGINSRVMLFDLATVGHHPIYIQYLVKYWQEKELPGKLDIVVSPNFLDEHHSIITHSKINQSQSIRFIPVEQKDYSNYISQKKIINSIFIEWDISRKYATRLKVDHCLFMYLDRLQLPIVLGDNFPCLFSGIYFRPTLHYDDFDNSLPSWKDRLRQWRQRLLLSSVLRNPQFKFLFCLDPFAVKHIEKLNSKAKILYLPDPVQICETADLKTEQLKTRLGINCDRKIFLLFGYLESRKGIYQLLEAIKLLPPVACENLCLVLAGFIHPLEKLQIETLVREIAHSLPVQIITCNDFVPEQEVHLYFQMADVILAPYQRHVGMSGILLLAAAANKPVLSSNYGLLGQLVCQHKLGMTVDSTLPHEIADGIVKFISDVPQNFYDIKMMENFAKQHFHENFASVITNNIFD